MKEIQNLSKLNEIPFALDTLFSMQNLTYKPIAIVLKPTLQGGWFFVQKLQVQLRQKNNRLFFNKIIYYFLLH